METGCRSIIRVGIKVGPIMLARTVVLSSTDSLIP